MAVSDACFILFSAYYKALEDAIDVLDKIAMPIDTTDRKSCSLYPDNTTDCTKYALIEDIEKNV